MTVAWKRGLPRPKYLHEKLSPSYMKSYSYLSLYYIPTSKSQKEFFAAHTSLRFLKLLSGLSDRNFLESSVMECSLGFSVIRTSLGSFMVRFSLCFSRILSDRVLLRDISDSVLFRVVSDRVLFRFLGNLICGFGHIYWRNPEWKTSFFVQCLHFPVCRYFFIKKKN